MKKYQTSASLNFVMRDELGGKEDGRSGLGGICRVRRCEGGREGRRRTKDNACSELTEVFVR